MKSNDKQIKITEIQSIFIKIISFKEYKDNLDQNSEKISHPTKITTIIRQKNTFKNGENLTCVSSVPTFSAFLCPLKM